MMIHALSELGIPSMAETADHDAQTDRVERLRHIIEHAAHLLPARGPITVFIHHNTLLAFEDLPFDPGVRKRPYLPEEKFRREVDPVVRDRMLMETWRCVTRNVCPANGE